MLTSKAVAVHAMIETDNAVMILPDQPLTLRFHGYRKIDMAKFKETLTVMSLWDTYN